MQSARRQNCYVTPRCHGRIPAVSGLGGSGRWQWISLINMPIRVVALIRRRFLVFTGSHPDLSMAAVMR